MADVPCMWLNSGAFWKEVGPGPSLQTVRKTIKKKKKNEKEVKQKNTKTKKKEYYKDMEGVRIGRGLHAVPQTPSTTIIYFGHSIN